MSGPILPALRAHFHLAASSTGLITSAFPLGMFAAVFVFPVLSDLIGRKPVLVISYLGVGIAFTLQAAAVYLGLSFKTFLCLRVLAGAFAGASTVVKAYIADASSPSSLPQWMAFRESAATLAFIVGPTLGGLILASTSLSAIVFFEGFTSVFAGLLALFVLKSPARQTKTGFQRSGKEATSASCPLSYGAPWVPIVTTMVISCAYNFGQSFFDGFFSLLCAERYALKAPAIGSIQTAMALEIFCGSAFLYGPTVRKLGLVQTASVGLVLVAVGLTLLGLPRTLPGTLVGVFLYALGIPLFSPSVPTLLTQCAPAGRRGLVLGIDSAVNSVGRIFAPAVLGRLYEVSPSAAFGLVGCVVAAGSITMLVEKEGLGLIAKTLGRSPAPSLKPKGQEG